MLVLVADDDALLALDIQSTLEGAGHRVEVCLDGRAALARMRTLHPDVLITDLNMPGLRGDELIAEARKAGEDALTLLVTGERSGCSAGYGADRCLAKPFVPAQLLGAVGQLMAA